MASKLEPLVQADERILYQVRPSPGRNLWNFLKNFGPLALFLVGLDVLMSQVEPSQLLFCYVVLAFVGVFLAYTEFSIGEALLTDRRYLRRHGLFRPEVREVPLSQVRDVIGLETGSACGLGLRKRDKSVEYLSHLHNSEELALAICQAVGQASPQVPTPLPLRIRSGLIWAGLIGGFSGLSPLLLGPVLFLLFVSPRQVFVPVFVGEIIFLVPVVLSFLGYLICPIGLLVVPRFKVSADDMRRALDPYRPAGIEPGGSNFHAFWFRPILVPVASWLYGEAHGPAGRAEGHLGQ